MKILMTADNIGGVWTYATDMARGLKPLGVEVILAITGNPLTADQKKQLIGIRYYHEVFKQEWMDDPWDDIDEAGKWLMEIYHAHHPDMIHLNSYSFGTLSWQTPVMTTLHSCVLTWWEAVKKEKVPTSWDTYYRRIGKGIKAADMIIAPTHSLMKAAEAYYGPFNNKKVIYNGRSRNNFFTATKEKIIFAMGRLSDEAKNIQLIIEAAPHIHYPIYIAGDDTYWKGRSLPDNVYFQGILSPAEVASQLARTAIYLLPARYEPFGYSFLEAAFSSCALVGGDIPSLHEIWGNAMLYADPDDALHLARMINRVMETPGCVEKWGHKAGHRADFFNLDSMLDKYLSIYTLMIQHKKNLIIH
jgi:glycosyltransferase involved in cell wall biosynthesis